jgi:DNA-binding MarR family transcriptional regulator
MKLLGALHHGSKIMSELGDELGVTARNITTLVDALEEDQLVRRVPHATDRRATVIELTAAGAKYASQMATGAPLEAIAELFRGLTPDERKQLLGLVTKLHGLLIERGISGGHPCSASESPAE